jgi:hypothetical protein
MLQRVRTPLSPLPSPLAPDEDGDVVMRSRNGCDAKDGNDAAPVTAATAADSTTSYAIRALVRKKVVFSKRPTPIVGLSARATVACSDTVAGGSEGEAVRKP